MNKSWNFCYQNIICWKFLHIIQWSWHVSAGCYHLYQHGKVMFTLSASEDDACDYDDYSEEDPVKDRVLDPVVIPNAAELQQKKNLGV